MKRAGGPSDADLRAATEAVSARGSFHFTLRNLYYELVRREAMAAPAGDPDAGLAALRSSVRRFERRHGAIATLIRPEGVSRRRQPVRIEPDVYDYSVRRVLAFDRIDSMLLFAKNGFHRRVEVGLVAAGGFPAHVWRALGRQLDAGTPTTFLLVHDCDTGGHAAARATARRLARRPTARVVDVGLNFSQALRLGIPVRTTDDAPEGVDPGTDAVGDRVRRLLAQGYYAHFEEMPPLQALRWVYARVSKGAADVGFG